MLQSFIVLVIPNVVEIFQCTDDEGLSIRPEVEGQNSRLPINFHDSLRYVCGALIDEMAGGPAWKVLARDFSKSEILEST